MTNLIRSPSSAYRPQDFTPTLKLKERGLYLYKWHPRTECDSHILRVGKQLHYLACHSPLTVQKKWRSAWDKFYKRYHKVI